MDEYVYQVLNDYYNVLEKTGYINPSVTEGVLILTFYSDFLQHDYTGTLSVEDSKQIEKALYCLLGSNCLMFYPQDSIMGKIHTGSGGIIPGNIARILAALDRRVTDLEDQDVLKLVPTDEESGDFLPSDVEVYAKDI